MENELNITVSDGVKEVIIRHDNPAIVYEKRQIDLTGVITAPSEFYQKRKDQFEAGKTYVEFSKKDLSIKLVKDDVEHFRAIVLGKLVRHPFLLSMAINSDTTYSTKTLLNAIKWKRQFFEDKTAHQVLVRQLRNFTAQVETTVTEANDRGGNKSSQRDEKIKSFAKEEIRFNFSAPIFEGGDKFIIPIRVEMEPDNGQVRMYLVYDELDEVIEEEVDRIFAEQGEIFSEFALIVKS